MVQDLVENMVKENRSRFSIAVLLTTLICSHKTTADFSFLFYNCNFKILGACNTPLERYFQNLSSGILKAPKFLKLQLVNQKRKICSRLLTADQGGQENCNGQTNAVLSYHVFY
jgi:hypothetical protein